MKTTGYGESRNEILSFREAQEYAAYYHNQAFELLIEIENLSGSGAADSGSYSPPYVTDGTIFYGAI